MIKLSKRTILRLYYTTPLKERIIQRPKSWNKKLKQLKETQNEEEVKEILKWLSDNNRWIVNHVLPSWFLKITGTKEKDFAYKTEIEDILILPTECFCIDPSKFGKISGLSIIIERIK